MKKTSKILVTIGIIFLGLAFFGIISDTQKSSGGAGTGGIFGIIIVFGIIAAVRAIWKSKSNTSE